MAKNATIWRTEAGSGELTDGNAGSFLLLENGDNILLETGDDVLLEDNLYTPKAATGWSLESKNATGWHDHGSGEYNLENLGDVRITESGDTRITEAGDTRVLEDAELTPKAATAWTASDS